MTIAMDYDDTSRASRHSLSCLRSTVCMQPTAVSCKACRSDFSNFPAQRSTWVGKNTLIQETVPSSPTNNRTRATTMFFIPFIVRVATTTRSTTFSIFVYSIHFIRVDAINYFSMLFIPFISYVEQRLRDP